MSFPDKKITIVVICHKSKEKVLNFIDKINKNFKIIIIDNSNDINLRNIIKKNYNDISFKIIENKGYGAAINYACNLVTTDYFFVFNPDITNINDTIIDIFHKASIKLKSDFLCLGPRFLNVEEKSHNQSDINIKICQVKAINGACMFINKKKFKFIDGFDENFFLFFEENDFCKRGIDKKQKIYQLNEAKIIHEAGTSVKINDFFEKQKLQDLRTWHFIWSKFYFFKKHYTYFLAIIYFTPIIIRNLYRIFFYFVVNNNDKMKRYIIRLNGLIASICLKKSYKRI
tara:strand:- start:3228 stop:4085 length:858 start_codon:yes stop_codon:yes gene_type:complete